MEDKLSFQKLRPLSDLIGIDGEISFFYRKKAAVVSVVLPAMLVAICFLILIKGGPTSLLNFAAGRSLPGIPTIFGIIAGLLWIIRYTLPALKILSNNGTAIEKDEKYLYIFGKAHNLKDIDGFFEKNSIFENTIYIVSGGYIVEKISKIFIELR